MEWGAADRGVSVCPEIYFRCGGDSSKGLRFRVFRLRVFLYFYLEDGEKRPEDVIEGSDPAVGVFEVEALEPCVGVAVVSGPIDVCV